MSINWGQLGQLVTTGIICLIVLVRFREWAVRPATVEREQDSVRETAAASSQWHGVSTQPEYADEHETLYLRDNLDEIDFAARHIR